MRPILTKMTTSFAFNASRLYAPALVKRTSFWLSLRHNIFPLIIFLCIGCRQNTPCCLHTLFDVMVTSLRVWNTSPAL